VIEKAAISGIFPDTAAFSLSPECMEKEQPINLSIK
jgi:hypothetical protein